MTFEFTYTPADIRDLAKVDKKHAPKPAIRIDRGILGWLVFIGASIILIYVLRSNHPQVMSTAPVTQAPQQDSNSFLLLIPLLVIAAVVVVILVMGRRAFNNNPAYQKTQILTIDPDAVSVRTGPASSRWEWIAFDKFVESKLGFYLHVRDTKNWVLLPRRAIPNPQVEAEVLAIFESNVRPIGSAFPVIPIPPVS